MLNMLKGIRKSEKRVRFQTCHRVKTRIKVMNNSSKFIQRAIALANNAESLGEVPIGAVVVDPTGGKILGEGFNSTRSSNDPTAHAEIVAIRQAAKFVNNYRLPNFDLYVTLEPCAMCAGAISQARISRLFFATLDPKGGAVVNGVRYFDQSTCHSRPVVHRLCEFNDEVADQLKGFFKKLRG